ncbi:ATPase [Devosia sp. Root685]|uniref:AAA family ATPase n=1 Tax=Devosia sp. Root685 TaxID=1736587 RepID=UPI0007011715|nr:AAA family ATPase [Devosia sp. Root685]KRB01602.1 ATPase [Devosia sp. Root685]
MDRFTIISGCSGGGKSTLLEELARRGFSVIKEPGRRIVAAELAGDGKALPWIDAHAFLREAIALSLEDLERASALPGRVFFDRGLLDAASGLGEITGEPVLRQFAGQWRFNTKVFLTPPWPEIYQQDAERQHGLDAAIEEYERLLRDYPALGYDVVELPKVSVTARADFVLGHLGHLRNAFTAAPSSFGRA